MPFNNDIAGGNGTLVRNWIQSANFVAGTTGWRISKDGSAEFNNGTFRGSIEVGPLTGQHFIVNNTVTTDVIDIYDSLNRLIYSLDKNGIISCISEPGGQELQIVGNLLSFTNTVNPPNAPGNISGNISNTSAVMQMVSGKQTAGDTIAEIQLQSASSVGGPGGPALVGFQRDIATGGGVIFGSLIQSDVINSNNIFHVGSYSGTTDASGHLIFAHGAGFTPQDAVATGKAPGVGTFPNLTFGFDGFTSTLANISFIIANTNVVYANSPVMINCIFWK